MYGTAGEPAPESEATQAWDSAFINEYGSLPHVPYIKETYDAVVAIALAAQAANSLEGAPIRDHLRAIGSPPGHVIQATPDNIANALQLLRQWGRNRLRRGRRLRRLGRQRRPQSRLHRRLALHRRRRHRRRRNRPLPILTPSPLPLSSRIACPRVESLPPCRRGTGAGTHPSHALTSANPFSVGAGFKPAHSPSSHTCDPKRSRRISLHVIPSPSRNLVTTTPVAVPPHRYSRAPSRCPRGCGNPSPSPAQRLPLGRRGRQSIFRPSSLPTFPRPLPLSSRMRGPIPVPRTAPVPVKTDTGIHLSHVPPSSPTHRRGVPRSLFQKSPRVCPRQKGVTTGVTISTNAAIYD